MTKPEAVASVNSPVPRYTVDGRSVVLAADHDAAMAAMRGEVDRLREAVSAEREACAKLCETVGDKKEGHSIGYRSAAWECAGLIRGRGANHA